MPYKKITFFYFIVLSFVILPQLSSGADCPQWGGTDARNMVSDEKGLPESFEPGSKCSDGSGIDLSTTRNVKWAAKLGSQTYGNPTIADGKVFLGTNDYALDHPLCKVTRGGVVQCLDDTNGKLIWQLVAPRRYFDRPDALFNHLNLGICSAPTVEGDRVYLVTSRGEAICLDVNGLADGNDGPYTDEAKYITGNKNSTAELQSNDADIIWIYDMIAELPCLPQDAANCSILIHGDGLYVCTSNGVDKSHDVVPFPQAPSLIVLDKHTGRLVATDDEKMGTRLFHGLWSNPSLGVVGGKTLIFFGGGDGVCYAFEALKQIPDEPVKLKTVWSCDCLPPKYRFRDGKPIPYRSGDRRIARRFGEYGNKNDGNFVGPSEIIATPVFHDGLIYVAVGQDPMHGKGRGMMCCIDASKTGDVTESGKVWTYGGLQRTMSSVSVADGLAYIVDYPGTLHCLDAKTGEPVWVHETKSEAWGSTLVADGKIYLGAKSALYVFAAGREFKELAKIRLGSPMWCTPVAANSTLYFASQRYIWAVKNMPEQEEK